MTARNRRSAAIGLIVVGLLSVVPITSALTRDSASAAAARPGDGTTSATAGASCWGIKQQYPASADATYWVLNGSMARPLEVTCDMSSSGGGWVLVGRGQTGWTFHPAGQGTPSALQSAPNATTPVALGTTTVTELVDKAAMTSLVDGIRLERTIGSTRQDYRLHPAYQAWTWSFHAGQLLAKVQVDGTTYNGSNTKDTSATTHGQTTNALSGVKDNRRLVTSANTGFGYGSGTVAFTRVWLRPRIANGDANFTAIPAAGFPAQPRPATLKDRSELAPWGVVGLNHTDEAALTPWSTTANVIKSYGDRTFVGGRFTGVQQGPTGTPIGQASLAAFDLAGNWISTFRPTFTGRVWDLTMTDDGKLIVGGDFTSVNGLPNTAGLVALNPTSGAVITSWKANISRPGASAIVRALDVRGPWIYAAGRFTRVKGGSWNEITVSSAISLKASDGTPGTWKPVINASTVRLRVSADGSRVYLAGYFNAVNGDTNHGYHAITATATGAPVPGMGPWRAPSTSAHYQQAVAEYNGNPIVGGSEHDFQLYDRNRTRLIDSHITRQGGDFQTIEIEDGYVYAGCHCSDWLYQGTNSWTSPSGFRAINPIRLVGRWDAETFQYDTSWYPNALNGKPDEGVWSTTMDRNKCLWVAGDLNRGAYSGDAARDWLGGFARFCPEDSTPPSTVSRFTARAEGGSVTLAWGGSTDAGGAVSYDVYRNDRVIATVKGTTFVDTPDNGAVGTLRYTVRAVDPRGNRSASPAPATVAGPATTISTAVPFGATWKYRDDGSDQGTAWRAPGFDDGPWASGKAVLGWGGTQATTIGPTKPTTTYFRTSFTVADANQAKQLGLQLKVTQGAVVHLNGVEVGRWNMPAGAITSATTAAAYVGGTEDTVTKVFNVPGSLLRTGANILAVEVHGWRADSGKIFLDL
ncbi:MAG: hypothetical protein JWM47_2748, partial [Acidimicrobiales bacterium]|nr:hypothetical protein [Acidimicrobiales bacterium]